ncbi:hypothetical protein K4039_14980 [Lyngbya sp. CCAP 1446/10]|uniref:hypothetical protein n=1 Tax=Lyngbya sp. CCAP 1446/10 TaxID=439293 RepID=UPI0022377787|nr:hypothetical protein [Lyngbya sp. CCAP 1446/10]MCW6051356.1 hypothetical protein [Lyngbya sp. CCAP 1446/10]
MAWKNYTLEQNNQQFHSLDQIAQKLVLAAKDRVVLDKERKVLLDNKGQSKNSLNQSFKMREAVAYGLERFWGEHLRCQGKSKWNRDEFDNKSKYWKDTWDALVSIMHQAGVIIPNPPVDINRPDTVKSMAQELWKLDIQDQRIILAVLTQLCDCIVWWTQRYKGPGDLTVDDNN